MSLQNSRIPLPPSISRAFREAIDQCNHTFPVAAGAFRGTLALLLAQADQFDEAMSLLECGEPQVEPMPEEHAKFLCRKGQVQHMSGRAQPARESLQKAREIADTLTVTENSEVSQAVTALTLLLRNAEE